jgi:hypothetical protein
MNSLSARSLHYVIAVENLLWAHSPAIMLDSEDVAVEGGRPLLPLHGHLKVTQSIAYIAFNLAPKKIADSSRPCRQD